MENIDENEFEEQNERREIELRDAYEKRNGIDWLRLYSEHFPEKYEFSGLCMCNFCKDFAK